MENLSEEDQEMIQEFVTESEQNLAAMDEKVAALETNPQDADSVVCIFRTVHTIKGACGFLGFPILEGITVQAESLMGQIRDGKRALSPAHLNLVKETASAAHALLSSIKANLAEGPAHYEDLTERLRLATL